jgi:hypothetical protein
MDAKPICGGHNPLERRAGLKELRWGEQFIL